MKKNKGFTLIELMIVIMIVGILVAIFIPMVQKNITDVEVIPEAKIEVELKIDCEKKPL